MVDEVERDGFDELLDRIRQQQHPDYGSLRWNGENREVVVAVLFENGQSNEQEVRERALRYLESLTPAERAAADIDVQIKDGVPYRATLKAKTGDLSPDRVVGISYGSPNTPRNGVDKR